MNPTMSRTALLVFAALAAALSIPAPCAADTLTKTNGQTLTGRVISDDKDAVVFEVNLGGMSMRQRVPRNQVKSLQKEVREGPGYVALPIHGEIGVEVTADSLKRALNDARRYKPQYVILSIDSLGGLVAEKERIVEVIRQTRDVRFIAHVRRAVSAAAVIALACPEIYVADDATIGATVTVMAGPDGKMVAVEEKIQSVVRASDRAVATGAGHSDLWIRGMSERDLELSIRTERGGGVTRIVEATGDPSEQVIKRRGQILTLNGSEAVSYGLARATCPTVASIKDQLKLPAWHAVDDGPWHSMINHGKSARADHERLLRIGPVLREFQMKLGQTTARVLTIEAALAELTRQRDADLDRLREQYDRKMEAASRSIAEQARVERMYKAGQKRIHDYYGNQIAQGEQEVERARKELSRTKEEFDALVGAGE